MRRLFGFSKTYKLFSATVLTVIISLILELIGKHTLAHWLLGIMAIISLFPLIWDMWQEFRSGKYGIDILAATAILTSVILQQYWAAIVVVLMLTGGESLEDFAEHRAKSELDELLKRAPRTAHVIRKGKTLNVKVQDIKVGDKILIKAGELVPVDAIIIEGTASFDESSLTGESLPEFKQLNDSLLSGAINLDGAITARAIASSEESQYQQIIKLVRGAAASQAPFVRLADHYSIPFTFAAFSIALGVWAISGEAIRFLEVIIVATPCPLILAAPIALVSGMARASKYGIIVKTGSALERLAGAKSMAFDKTGTLTQGRLMVDEIIAMSDLSENQVLSLAANLESNSNHLVAVSIVNAARNKGLKLKRAKHVSEISGLGLKTVIKGQPVLVGRLNLMQQNNINFPSKASRKNISKTAVYVAQGTEIKGVITFRDELRPDTKSTLEEIKSQGIKKFIMITGDNQATAELIAHNLNIKDVYAEALPADKLRILEETIERPVAFVGDGINDAPILAAADVGIALGARGSMAASESADMVIMQDDISRVAAALKIAKETFRIAKQSILVGIGLSLALMLIFATGKFSPLAGAIIQEGVDVVVIFNALRAHLITIND
ncbi:MAG TPA: heavy metal translocating P-type ATPase [Candidatus Saccharimonadales bacterium]|nr:heavy metal translocating P-type ATPase [Candidatus Saccharimonadales bacterium]